jgi:hypothetical protein
VELCTSLSGYSTLKLPDINTQVSGKFIDIKLQVNIVNPVICDKYKQDRQWTYNATLRRVRLTMDCRGKATSITYYRVCLYSWLSYPAGRSHPFCAVLYCHLWRVWLYHIFQHCLIIGMILGKSLLNIKCVLIFSTTFV